eukprot:NODE_7282_length_793_cov_23.247761_g6673_i0.p1 GENE.NODE_7282_length_793_cov_23.247761_g6673_i0~~NODE_7282_length_793_cov_23.247761_g6673_i0.p1  ORF type:complete len:226 (-),score=28.43 NODE_7282_length_793_cov_23.247761_g6673_i0:49-726(-)
MASGTGVIALKYNGGVLLASDTLLSYGSLARYPNIQRIKQVGDKTAIAASGDYADFQYIANQLDELIVEDQLQDDGVSLGPKEVHGWLSQLMYNSRCKFEPLLNTVLVTGFQDGKSFLGFVDSIGTHFTCEDCMATGLASHLAMPLLRKKFESNPAMSREQAIEAIEEALTLMFYRDCRAFAKYQIADCTAAGVNISAPRLLNTKWDYKGFDFEVTKLITLPGTY